MCGVCGFQGRFQHADLERANELLCHRGPDDCGVFFDDAAHVGIAHRRLSIIDVSAAGHQPMFGDRKVSITFNGEIYNFRELKQELAGKGHTFRSQSDTEVLLKLHATSGEGMLQRLNGIFAFGIWDPTDGSLFVARDALGVKPLYYAETSDGFCFASEIKALLPFLGPQRELDPIALHRYVSFL
jgi:asparagine synthase (glutamine-hydrolysing)